MIKDAIETWNELPNKTRFQIKSLTVAYGMGFVTALLVVGLFT